MNKESPHSCGDANARFLNSAKLLQRHFIRIHDKSVMAPYLNLREDVVKQVAV